MVVGADDVSLAAPTDPQSPYVITYNAEDDAGNAAKTKYRRVHVVCPPGEVYCPDSGSGSRQCSCQGVCGVEGSSCMQPEVVEPDYPLVGFNIGLVLYGE